MSHIGFNYLCFEPAVLEARMPLIVYLHGAGHKGTSLDKLATASLPSLLQEGLELPATVVCPLAKPGPGWPIQQIAIFIEEVARVHASDPLRIYLTGESMGGRGVFEIAYWHHGLLAAAAPLCAFGIPNLAPILKTLPLWMFHGSEDDVLPVARSEEMIAALNKAGAPARFTRLEGEGHPIGRQVYARQDLWDWMFKQKRTNSFLEI